MFIADQHWGNRSTGAYAWRTLQRSGTAMAFGSDAPVESPNPFWGLHAAVTRTRQDGQPGPDGWYPEQRLSAQEALAGFTTGPAFASQQEKQLGQLAPGYFADLIVLDGDPFEQPLINLYRVLPEMTMIAGQWVWRG
jgi:predicted amidohydrolase YtcJ